MKRIENLAHRLVKRYGTSSPFELCDYLRIDILRADLPAAVRGLCFQKCADGSVILLNRGLGPRESRYCCAHELGHVLLHPGINAQVMADLTNLCIPRLEREADFFAACLLVDPNLEEWNRNFDPLTVQQIACLAGLPEKAVRLRLDAEEKKRLEGFRKK